MPRHHFLPASYLGLFSTDERDISLRQKILSIGNKQSGKVFNGPATNIGCIKNFYRLTDAPDGTDSDSIDKIWSKYEMDLPSAINQLINQTIDTEKWARVLVPFVACLLLRGPDFNFRFKRRLHSIGIDYKFPALTEDNTITVRQMELQRLLAPILSSRWIVVTIHGEENLITNDLGYAPFFDPLFGDSGMAIPLDLRHILMIAPQKSRTITRWIDGKWMPIIEYRNQPVDKQNKFNETIARVAQRFICGSNEERIRNYFRLMQTVTLFSLEPQELGFIAGRDAIAQEFTWHRLVCSLSKNPNDIKIDGFPIDWKVISIGWHPPPNIPTNLLEFPPSLHLVGQEITVEFYNPEIYFIISEIMMGNELRDFKVVIKESSRGLKLPITDKQKNQLLIARADANIELGLYTAAYDDYLEAINIDDRNPGAFINQGFALAKGGKINEAIISFTHAIDLDHSLGVAYLNRGSMYAEKTKYDDALNDFARAVDLLQDNNDKADAYFNRGSVLLLVNRDQDGVQDLEYAITLYDDPIKISNCYYKLAAIHYSHDNFQDALDCLSIAIKQKPSFFEALCFRAQIFKEKEQFTKAIEDLILAFPLCPDTKNKINILHLTGVVYGELRLFEQAESCFNQGMKISEDKTRFLYSKGVLYLFQGKLDLAIECFKSAILIQPNFSPALNNLGVCTAIMNDHVEAINIFNRSLDSSPTDVSRANAYSNKAISLSYLNDKNGANASLDAAIKIQPDDINNLITKGRIQLFQNKYKLALRTAKQIQSKQIEKDSYPLDAVSKIALGDFQDATSRFHLWLNQKPLPFLRLIVLSDLTYLQRKSKFGEEIQSIISIISAYADK